MDQLDDILFFPKIPKNGIEMEDNITYKFTLISKPENIVYGIRSGDIVCYDSKNRIHVKDIDSFAGWIVELAD